MSTPHGAAAPATPPVPLNADILGVVHRLQPVSLRRIAAELWPGLPWLPERPGGDSARRTTFEWPRPEGELPARLTAAQLLYLRCQALVTRGWLVPAGPDLSEPDPLARHAYRVAPAPCSPRAAGPGDAGGGAEGGAAHA